jgi:hypothetical protein
MIDMYSDDLQRQAAIAENRQYDSKYFDQQEVKTIKSMKEIPGW